MRPRLAQTGVHWTPLTPVSQRMWVYKMNEKDITLLGKDILLLPDKINEMWHRVGNFSRFYFIFYKKNLFFSKK
jgi:hypothetical protein